MAPTATPATKNLAHANLAGDDLAEVDLEGADLTGANPEAARSLAGTKLRRTRGLSPVQWEACAGRWAVVDDGVAAGDPTPAP